MPRSPRRGGGEDASTTSRCPANSRSWTAGAPWIRRRARLASCRAAAEERTTALPPADLLAAWRAGTAERIAAAGGALQATLVTETQANDFAQLPMREDERVAVTIMGGDTDPSAHEAPELQAFRTPAHPVLSRLEPTDRSAWRG